jgi:rfaE bifunctional protein nucleotidyltransferase chain/domain
VGINSDASVRRLNKGPDRPINCLDDRAAILAALESVSLVIAFHEDTPLTLIRALHPDVLVKGGDWPVDKIVGAQDVLAGGGRVVSIPFRFQRSTSALIEAIRR